MKQMKSEINRQYVNQNFYGNMEGEVFSHCYFRNCRFDNVNFRGCQFDHCTFKNVMMIVTDVSGAYFNFCIFQNADMIKSNFETSVIKNCRFDSVRSYQNRTSELRIFLDNGSINDWINYEKKIQGILSADSI